jgi:hypothetical protein
VRTYNGGNERKLSIITTVPQLYAYYGTDTLGGLLEQNRTEHIFYFHPSIFQYNMGA